MPTIDLGSVVGPQGAQGPQGATGATGAQGAAGPNQVSANTSTTLDGVLAGANGVVGTIAVDSAPVSANTSHLISSAAVWAATMGYGLGTTGKLLTSADDLNNITAEGFYCYNGNSKPAHYPFDNYTSIVVVSAASARIVQYAIPMNSADKGERRREYFGSTWSEWEWINPPLVLDTEYRTTERYNGKPVYVKVVSVSSVPANEFTAVSVAAGGDMPVDIKMLSSDSSGNKFNTIYAPYLTYLRLGVTAAGGVNAQIQTTTALSNPVYFICKYTKT